MAVDGSLIEIDAAGPQKSQKFFGEIAIEKGLVNEAQVEECLAIQKALKRKGDEKTLGAVMHDKGYLSLIQVNEIMAAVEGSKRRQSLEGYEIISKLGQGGMGTVYLARQVSLNKLVAVKVLPPKLARNKDYLKRFYREAQATAKLNHPHIVQAIDVGESNGYYYFVMEYVEGETVKEMLARQGIVEEDRAIEIATQVASALKHAWQHHIIHRDIKPGNVMITRDGQAKLCDLGLAFDLKEDGTITKSGIIMGTPYYLSPEQARTEELDIRSDIYSLGATLFHMATGTVPYEGETAAVILTKHLAEPVPDPMERNPILSKGFCFILQRTMQKRPEDRYQTPDELLSDLSDLRDPKFMRGKAYTPKVEPSRTKKSRDVRRAVLIAGAVTFLIFVPVATTYLPDLWRTPVDARSSGGSGDPRNNMEDTARRALLAAVAAFEENPDALDDAMARYLAVERDYPETQAAREARDRQAAIRERIDELARHAYLTLEASVRPLVDQGRYRAATEAVEQYPPRFRGTVWFERAYRLREHIREKARESFDEARAQAAECAAAADFAGAVAALEPFRTIGVPDLEQAAAQEIQRLERQAGDVTLPPLPGEGADRGLLGRAVRAVLERLDASGFQAASEQAHTLIGDPTYARVRPWLRTVTRDVDDLREIGERAQAWFAGRAGQEVDIGVEGLRQAGEMVSSEDGLLRIDVGGGTLVIPLVRLDPGDILRAAEVAPDTPRGLLLTGILAIARIAGGATGSDPRTVRSMLETIEQRVGHPVETYLLVLDESGSPP